MRLVALVACHEEDVEQLSDCLDTLRGVVDRAVLVCSSDREKHRLFDRLADRYTFGLAIHARRFTRERDKRNRLLQLGQAFEPDWLLSIDADETLVHGEQLRPALRYFDAQAAGPLLPAYPLLRREPELWTVLPSKLIRADVETFAYLDIAVRWQGQTWDLDQQQLGPELSSVNGFPFLRHWPSSRSLEPAGDGFYAELEPLHAERHYVDEFARLGAGAGAR